ncbi:DUF4258 domain-containing protein [Psychroflexus gondwanensis]|jgi:hypothetical protein|uniref:DUF4258 domain-containing protein n=1 Tax=Psychroflexus gondwanensis ACAM 44 TaxID=1189619 RepID=N1X0J9_9FLAO|nr:DUF4258 domain-containing protein [Psychroflexus gondwanensis]EMY81553.1 hypothetical protein pgond44_06870 [Psychroflexus gondwanensis ACAM 44]TXE20979.1 DUF4258 domain-containing protein [Psychroflexus gondwanensis]
MKFIHRLGYYLSGFVVGIIMLMFFLGGKKTSCDWGLDSRVLKNIRIKDRVVTDEALEFFNQKKIDTSAISYILKSGDVNFKESNIEAKPCKIYQIEGEINEERLGLIFENCDSIATLKNVFILK